MFALTQYPLPYASDALAPYISQRAMDLHHGRHVAAYINNLNDLIADTAYADMPLMTIITTSHAADDAKVFNNAAQIYNHEIFFNSMTPDNSNMTIPVQIADAFGGADEFKRQFKAAASSVFGSGWTWLVRDGYDYKIVTTANADTPVVHGQKPLLALDVWEHAYYPDYENRRAEFIDAYLDHLVNWKFVEENM